MTPTSKEKLENMGWEFLPAGPDGWKWLKFDGNRVICQQGSDIWFHDLALSGHPTTGPGSKKVNPYE